MRKCLLTLRNQIDIKVRLTTAKLLVKPIGSEIVKALCRWGYCHHPSTSKV